MSKTPCDEFDYCPYGAEYADDCARCCGVGEDVSDDPALWEEEDGRD